ncbi:hypothetical protein OTU49_001211, partial [Cherax quadricarinatus]
GGMGSLRCASLLRQVTGPWSRCTPSRVTYYYCHACKYSSSSDRDSWVMKSPFSDVDIPIVSFSKYIFDAQEQFGGRTAMVDGVTGASYSFSEFRDKSIRLGSALTRIDISYKDVVAIVAPNCPEFAITFFAVTSIGAINTTINCTYTADEIANQLNNAGASAVVTHPLLLSKVKEASKLCKNLHHIIVMGPAEEGLLSLQDLMKDDGTAFPHNIQIDPQDDLVVLPYSSGTTGLPKGVMLTHYNLVANLQQILHEGLNTLKAGTDGYQEVFMGLLPYFHIYGMVTCMGLSLLCGAKSVTLPNFDPKLFVDVLEKHKISYLHSVPPVVSFLAHHPLVKPEHLSHTHTVSSGAAPAGSTLINNFIKKFGSEIIFQEGYGMTETSPVTHLTPKDNHVVGSIGVVIPNTMAKIIDISTGEAIGPNEGEGELCIKGPQVMKGYFRNEEETRNTIDEDGWLHTGDIAKADANDNVFIVDRLKELIKVKGLQVAPAELEDVIRKHPHVADVAVIGLPHERSGEVPRAYVVLVPGSNVSEKAIADYVADEVAPHKQLSGGVKFVDTIPKSPTGKILRRELKETALAQ